MNPTAGLDCGDEVHMLSLSDIEQQTFYLAACSPAVYVVYGVNNNVATTTTTTTTTTIVTTTTNNKNNNNNMNTKTSTKIS